MINYIRKRLDRYFARILAPLAHKKDIDRLYTQIDALLSIKDILGPKILLDPLRGWPVDPDALLIVLRELLARKSPRVLEFGAGESTIAISSVLKQMGAGSLVTIEHDAPFAKKIATRLQGSGLQDAASFRIVPLQEYNARLGLPKFTSYDLTGVDIDFDVAFIDGPIMYQLGAATRSIPLDWCVKRLGKGGIIFMDDAARPEEAAIIEGLRPEWHDIAAQTIDTQAGLLRLVRK